MPIVCIENGWALLMTGPIYLSQVYVRQWRGSVKEESPSSQAHKRYSFSHEMGGRLCVLVKWSSLTGGPTYLFLRKIKLFFIWMPLVERGRAVCEGRIGSLQRGERRRQNSRIKWDKQAIGEIKNPGINVGKGKRERDGWKNERQNEME